MRAARTACPRSFNKWFAPLPRDEATRMARRPEDLAGVLDADRGVRRRMQHHQGQPELTANREVDLIAATVDDDAHRWLITR